MAPEDLPSLAQERTILLVDVRSRWHHRHGHIPGSHSIPAGLLLAGEWPDGDLLLIGVDSAQSQSLIETMHDLGYNRQLRFLQGGYQAWAATTSKANRPVDLWEQRLLSGRRLLAGPALVIAGSWNQSLALMAFGLVVLFGPSTLKRSRA